MEITRIKTYISYRKRKILAIVALFLIITTLFPSYAMAASTPDVTATTPDSSPKSEIVVITEPDQWWIEYPDGQKVKFEDVAVYKFSTEVGTLRIYDNNDNVLQIPVLPAISYMNSKGYWIIEDEEEIGLLQSILDTLETIGTHVIYFAEAVASGQLLSMIFTSIIYLAGDGVGELLVEIINLVDSTEELFKNPIALILVNFANFFGAMLWIIGFVIATGEIIINYKSNRQLSDSLHDYTLNFFKSFFAVISFTVIPLPLYVLVSNLATKISQLIINTGIGRMKDMSMNSLDWVSAPSNLMLLIFFIVMIFAGFKVLFSFIKRGGILMILILIGSIHMINIPRGYWDAFWSWCRQVIGLCITQFCQIAIFSAGIAVIFETLTMSMSHFLAGLSLLLAASEVPRIAERYGLDTSVRGNASGVVNTVATAARLIIMKH